MYLAEDRTSLSYNLKRPGLIGALIGQIDNTLPRYSPGLGFRTSLSLSMIKKPHCCSCRVPGAFMLQLFHYRRTRHAKECILLGDGYKHHKVREMETLDNEFCDQGMPLVHRFTMPASSLAYQEPSTAPSLSHFSGHPPNRHPTHEWPGQLHSVGLG